MHVSARYQHQIKINSRSGEVYSDLGRNAETSQQPLFPPETVNHTME